MPTNEGTEGFSSFTKENASERCTTCTATDMVENVGIKEHYAWKSVKLTH